MICEHNVRAKAKFQRKPDGEAFYLRVIDIMKELFIEKKRIRIILGIRNFALIQDIKRISSFGKRRKNSLIGDISQTSFYYSSFRCSNFNFFFIKNISGIQNISINLQTV